MSSSWKHDDQLIGWGKRRRVRKHIRKYAIPNNGGMKLAGSKEPPKDIMYS